MELSASALLLLLALLPQLWATEGSRKYKLLAEDYYWWKAWSDPFWSSASLRTAEEAGDKCRGFAKRAEEILEAEPPIVSGMEEYYTEMIHRQCTDLLGGLELGAHLLGPVHFMGGLQTGLPDGFARPSYVRSLTTGGHFSVALARLSKVPEVAREAVELLREGARRGMTHAEESIGERVRGQFERLVEGGPEGSGFYEPFRDMGARRLRGVDQEEAEAIQERARAVIGGQILPAMSELADYLLGEYSGRLRPGPGVSNLLGEDGQEYYRRCLRHHNSFRNLTALQVHEIGLEEVRTLREKVSDLAASGALGFDPDGNLTVREIFSRVRDDPEQGFETEKDLLRHVRTLIATRINPRLSRVLPEEYITTRLHSLRVRGVREDGTVASYRQDSDGGAFVINMEELEDYRKFDLLSLTLHEGNPGHHLTGYANPHRSEQPHFLRTGGQCFGGHASVPAAVPWYTGFIEGWALYAEWLGHEMGLYEEDPLDLLGFYSWNLLRGARLVVDTGLHAFGWSRQDAVDYLRENTGLGELTIGVEVDRYITWPGQATAYKIGERTIKDLRRKLESELGAAFDLKAFHRRLIPCLGPLDKLERCYRMQEEREEEESKQ